MGHHNQRHVRRTAGDEENTYVAASLVVLAVRLDPVQTQRVQERRQTLKRVDQISRRLCTTITIRDAVLA